MPPPRDSHTSRIMLVQLAVFSMLSGANNGYTLIIIGFVLRRLQLTDISDDELRPGLVGSVAYLGLMIGCPFGGWLARRIGRRGRAGGSRPFCQIENSDQRPVAHTPTALWALARRGLSSRQRRPPLPFLP